MKLVTFDFWQTLLADTPESGAAAQALRLPGVADALRRAGYAYDAVALETADVRALARLNAIWETHRDVSPAEQVCVFLKALDPALPGALTREQHAAAERAYAIPVLIHTPVVAPGAVDAIRTLAERGLALAIISNTGRTPGTMLRRLLERAGVLDAFRVLSFSDEVGFRKPDARIFRRTLEAAGAEPAAAVHVGDDPVNDVTGARAVGMRASTTCPTAARRPSRRIPSSGTWPSCPTSSPVCSKLGRGRPGCMQSRPGRPGWSFAWYRGCHHDRSTGEARDAVPS